MSQIASTSTRRLRRSAIVAAALASLLVPASGAASYTSVASSQSYVSPDARAATAVSTRPAKQDLRSPDAMDTARGAVRVPGQDLRSPDARQSGRFVSQPQPQQPGTPSGGFDWVYLAIGGLLSLVVAASVLLAQRRRRHAMAMGR
jgi:hypothetical protein